MAAGKKVSAWLYTNRPFHRRQLLSYSFDVHVLHGGKGRFQATDQACWGVGELNLTVDLGGEAALDQAGAEATPCRRTQDRWAALLGPGQAELGGRVLVDHVPAQIHEAVIVRERAIFRSVGGQLG